MINDVVKFACLEVTAKPPPRTAADIARWREVWCSAGALKRAASTDDTLLIDGHWLVKAAEAGTVLSKRQQLPDGAAADRDALLNSLWEDTSRPWERCKEHSYIGGISYCWATAQHPDPNGEQLKRLRAPLKCFLDGNPSSRTSAVAQVLSLAVFLDWCSLYQAERTDDELEVFKRGLKNVNLWYAHPLTWVFALTVVPAGVKPFLERGWPRFEKAVSTLIKDRTMFLDLGAAEEAKEEWRGASVISRGSAATKRDAPMTPLEFRELLKTLSFTNGSDRAFVLEKYQRTFTEITGAAELLSYDGNAFTSFDDHFFEWCPEVKKLDLVACNQLISLPDSIWHLQACTEISLSVKSLKSLPTSIGNLQACAIVSIYSDCVESLPDSIGSLQACTKISLLLKSLKSLPDSIGNLQACADVSISSDCMGSLPDSIGSLQACKKISLSLKSLKSLPDSIGNLPACEVISLKNCTGLKELPDSIGSLPACEVISLENCTCLESLPDSIATLRVCKGIKLDRCTSLKSLPDSVKKSMKGRIVLTNMKGHADIPQPPAAVKALIAGRC